MTIISFIYLFNSSSKQVVAIVQCCNIELVNRKFHQLPAPILPYIAVIRQLNHLLRPGIYPHPDFHRRSLLHCRVITVMHRSMEDPSTVLVIVKGKNDRISSFKIYRIYLICFLFITFDANTTILCFILQLFFSISISDAVFAYSFANSRKTWL